MLLFKSTIEFYTPMYQKVLIKIPDTFVLKLLVRCDVSERRFVETQEARREDSSVSRE